MGANATVVIPGAAAKTPAAINGLTAALSGNNVALNWPAVTQATDGSALTCAGLPGLCAGQRSLRSRRRRRTWWRKWRARRSRTVGGLGDVAQNYTYVVTAIGNNCWKLESTPSKRVGRFGFTMAPGL